MGSGRAGWGGPGMGFGRGAAWGGPGQGQGWARGRFRSAVRDVGRAVERAVVSDPGRPGPRSPAEAAFVDEDNDGICDHYELRHGMHK